MLIMTYRNLRQSKVGHRNTLAINFTSALGNCGGALRPSPIAAIPPPLPVGVMYTTSRYDTS